MEKDCRLVDEVYRPELTGYFRDGLRRVDLVLVLAQMGNVNIEELQINLLRGTVEVGLELEVEFGVMEQLKHLIFVKVHAPAKLIEEFGELYCEDKPFKQVHLELISPNKGLVQWVTALWQPWYEREYVGLIRRQYPEPSEYSTLERSRIVYRLMQLVRFGDHNDHIGLHRLLDSAVVHDVFPLHDGPYFHIPRQLKEILRLDWVGYHNLLKPQPVHVIREYLGERIGFLFAFFELINRMMIPVVLLSVFVFVCGLYYDSTDEMVNNAACKKEKYTYLKWLSGLSYWYYTFSEFHSNQAYNWNKYSDTQYPYLYNRTVSATLTYYSTSWKIKHCTWGWFQRTYSTWDYIWYYNKTFEDRIHCRQWWSVSHDYSDLPVCPTCDNLDICPFRNLTEYCEEVKVKTMLDNPYAIPFSFAVSLWGVLLYLLWKRREAYLYWIWEVNKTDTDGVMRPEYAVTLLAPARGAQLSAVAALGKALIKEFVVFGILALYCYGFTVVVMSAARAALQLQFRQYDSDWDFRKINYALYVLMATINTCMTVLLEKTGREKVHVLLNWTNPRTPAEYEKELVLRMFFFALTFNVWYLFHLAFVKGQLYTHPGSESRGREHCGLLSCIDEVCIAIVVTIIVKHMFLGCASIVECKRTDYNRKLNDDVPCWEKEYLLHPLTDKEIMHKMETLMIQLAMATFFASMVPLATVAIFVINLWMIRRWAEDMLLRSRRPLLKTNWGLGCWNGVVQTLPFVAAACNALATALNSNIFDVNMHTRHFPDRRFFADITMSFFNISTAFPYGNRTLSTHIYFPHFCLFPGKWNRIQRFYDDKAFDRTLELFIPTVLKVYINANQMEFFVLFMVMVIISTLILYRLVETKPRDVAETEERQRAVVHLLAGKQGPQIRMRPRPRVKQD